MIVRNKGYKNGNVKVVFELSKADLEGFDAVISAFAAWTPETFGLHKKVAKHLADALSGTKTRLLVVGGAGTLYVDDKGTMAMDAPDFPSEYMGVAKATAESFFELKGRTDVLWTYVSPAGDYDANGARTGKYNLGGDNLILNSKKRELHQLRRPSACGHRRAKKRRLRAKTLYRRGREGVSLKFCVI
ncbi:NAD(P)-dependent oxidoreductase [Campylobacter massiliensis]|uniref:NAD(P)-dependent oxidoreductase n=1 Tax=Campylobacter massiliensis TaxID=2762557 RepID=UPI001E525930|nr:hypothetical protein [Campylobacter massiliensis]